MTKKKSEESAGANAELTAPSKENAASVRPAPSMDKPTIPPLPKAHPISDEKIVRLWGDLHFKEFEAADVEEATNGICEEKAAIRLFRLAYEKGRADERKKQVGK